jgi:hypothetical protein
VRVRKPREKILQHPQHNLPGKDLDQILPPKDDNILAKLQNQNPNTAITVDFFATSQHRSRDSSNLSSLRKLLVRCEGEMFGIRRLEKK